MGQNLKIHCEDQHDLPTPCTPTWTVRYIKCHPKPVSEECRWVINPSHRASTLMTADNVQQHAEFTVDDTPYTVPCGCLYKHKLPRLSQTCCHTDMNISKVTWCLTSDKNFISLERKQEML